MGTETLIITSDEDAISLLSDLTEGKINAENIKIELNNWPNINVYLKGDQFHQSMTPTVMTGFVELQKNLYKTFALLKYQDSSRRLTPEEKKQLEITVTVKDGSTDLSAKLEKPLVEIAKGIASGVQGMDSFHLLIGVLGTGLLFAGYSAYSKYLQHRTEVRLKEVESQKNAEDKEVRLAELKLLSFTNEQETKRLQVLEKMFVSHPQYKPIEDYAYNAHTELLKSASTADSATIQGSIMGAGVIDELKRNARKKSVEDRLTGTFKVIGTDHSNKEECKLKLENVVSGETITASLIENMDSLHYARMKKRIIEAAWSDTPITFRNF